ncbi:unnamed protein product [Rhizoctonia solani]|uniref:Uncharacterized protein n=1 Tax=Rhizoctonia solani TaxID=456999 RepID=A0A8H3BN48_9AGAM|nr:unnamed protein product [Rhizoctonia solani]
MYIHTKFQKLKATIKSIMSSDMDTIPPDINDVVPSFDPRFRNWPQLYILHQTLEHSRKDKDLLIRTRWTTEFIGCLDIFEARLKEHHEYEILQGELEVLFKELQQFYHDREAARPEMTNATRGLYLSIEHELLHLSEQWGRDGWETHDTVEHAEDFVMTCYRRIQSLLQGITLNLLAWQDDRMTYTIDLMSQLLEYVSIAPLLREKSGHDDTIEDRSCATSTRAKVLKGVSAWISDPSSDSVYWINGMTRTVNTAIAYNLSRQLKEQYKLAATYQLAQFSWPFRRALLKALSLKDPKWHPIA